MLESDTKNRYCPFALNQVATDAQATTHKQCRGAKCMAWEFEDDAPESLHGFCVLIEAAKR